MENVLRDLRFGLQGLLLAQVGIYSAFSASQSTQEVGVRMAFGAQENDVLKMVVQQGALLALAGVAVGLAVALGLAKIHIAVAMVASYIPARRAVMTDLMVALRNE